MLIPAFQLYLGGTWHERCTMLKRLTTSRQRGAQGMVAAAPPRAVVCASLATPPPGTAHAPPPHMPPAALESRACAAGRGGRGLLQRATREPGVRDAGGQGVCLQPARHGRPAAGHAEHKQGGHGARCRWVCAPSHEATMHYDCSFLGLSSGECSRWKLLRSCCRIRRRRALALGSCSRPGTGAHCHRPPGALLPSSSRDVLLIGSANTLQCYDVERNRYADSAPLRQQTSGRARPPHPVKGRGESEQLPASRALEQAIRKQRSWRTRHRALHVARAQLFAMHAEWRRRRMRHDSLVV
jgi:hypothetical protein